MTNKKIVIIAVTYKSDQTAIEYIKTLKLLDTSKTELLIILVDNTLRKNSDKLFECVKNVNQSVICIKTKDNIGYFPAVRIAYEYLIEKHILYDYIIVSNVDIKSISSDIFTQIDENASDNVAVIAPKIISCKTNINKNPKVINRYTKEKIKFFRLICSNFIVFNVYLIFSNYIKPVLLRARKSDSLLNRRIYAPHGSFMIFSSKYFNRGGNFNYPIFLFGEELFVGETVRKMNLTVLYCPRIVVTDIEHVSTGIFKSRSMVRSMYESIHYIGKQYYQLWIK